MTFGEYVHSKTESRLREFERKPVGERPHDQQYRVRPHRTGLVNLRFINHEVFSQRRNTDGSARRTKRGFRALKVDAVG